MPATRTSANHETECRHESRRPEAYRGDDEAANDDRDRGHAVGETAHDHRAHGRHAEECRDNAAGSRVAKPELLQDQREDRRQYEPVDVIRTVTHVAEKGYAGS